MKGAIKASISVLAAAVMLGACASKGPASPATPLTGAAAEDETAAQYKQLVDNVNQQLVCKREAVTGSRIDSVVCLTPAQMEEQSLRAADVVREIRENAARQSMQQQQRPQMPPSQPPKP